MKEKERTFQQKEQHVQKCQGVRPHEEWREAGVARKQKLRDE